MSAKISADYNNLSKKILRFAPVAETQDAQGDILDCIHIEAKEFVEKPGMFNDCKGYYSSMCRFCVTM